MERSFIRDTSSSFGSEFHAGLLTASRIFKCMREDTPSSYQMNVPVNPSLINYAPASLYDSVSKEDEDDSSESEEVLQGEQEINKAHKVDESETCQQLWRLFRDEAGPWNTHRFETSEWEPTKSTSKMPSRGFSNMPGEFDGILTKEFIAPHLSKLDRSPEIGNYAYTRCDLEKKKLINIDALNSYHYLQYIDLSVNKLTTLRALENLPFLKYLDASHNLLSTILDFKAPYFLTTVNLSHNKIKCMRDLSDFWSITDLNLSHNGIKIIDGLQNLRYLTTLNMATNKIENIDNLKGLRVQFLYLQYNNLKMTENEDGSILPTLKNIRCINMSHNQISSLKNFEMVENIEVLEFINNNIGKLLDIYHLRNLKVLNKLNLAGNPVTSMKRYEEVCVTLIKNLTYLDGERINSNFWLEKISNTTTDVTQVATNSRLKLTVLDHMNPPQIWSWLVPYDSPPIAIIVLVGLRASGRSHIVRKFCSEHKNVVVGIPSTTKPMFEGEVEGQHFYYMNEETFMAMLKKGEFLTYYEDLGHYYGITHSELKKAENGIVIFHSDLNMGLSIKRKFLNTTLVLALPSCKRAHLVNLSNLFAVYCTENNVSRIVNSPVLAATRQEEFLKEKQKILETEAQHVLEELITSVCSAVDEIETDVQQSNDLDLSSDTTEQEELFQSSSNRPSMTSSGKSEKSDIFQLWWTPAAPAPTMSMMIHPSALSSMFIARKQSRDSESSALVTEQPKMTGQSIMNTDQVKRFVSFTVGNFDKTKIMEEEDDDTTSQVTIESCKKKKDSEEPKVTEEYQEPEKNQEQLGAIYASLPGSATKKDLVESRSYAEILSRDPRMKTFFDEELQLRDELLELHLLNPGLFRELIYTDQEAESLNKLNKLVKAIARFSETTKKTLMTFENDENFSVIIKAKISNRFTELRREVVKSETQERNSNPVICLESECDNPLCPEW